MFDGKAFGLEVVGVVKAHVEKSLAPILARMAEMETRLAELPANQDAVNRSLAGLMHQVDELRETANSATKELLVEPVELPDFPALIAVEVEKAVSAIEKPMDGAPGIDGKDGAPGVDGPAGKDGKDGRDGCDIADAMQDKDGNLVVTFTDGRIKTIGNIQGKDGKDGASVDMDAIKAILPTPEIDVKAVAKMIDEAVLRQSIEDFAPDDVAETVSLAIKTMAGYAQKFVPAVEPKQAPPLTLNVLPSVSVNLPDQAVPIVNNKMDTPVVNVQPPNVNIEMPKRGKEVTRVTEWDKSGRIKSFEKTEVEQ